MNNISDVVRRGAVRWPDRPCVSFDTRTHTYREFAEIVGGLAEELRAHGVEPGHHVITISGNSDLLLAAYIAIGSLGAINVPVTTLATAAEIEDIASRTAAKLVVHAPPYAAVVDLVRRAVPTLEPMLLLGEPGADPAGFARAPIPAPPAEADDRATAMVLFTSGSTGRPKGCVKSHRNLIWHSLNAQLSAARSMHDRELYAIPLAGIGVSNFAMVPMLSGGCLVLMRFEPTQVLELLAAGGITRMFLPPTMLHAMLAVAPPGPVPAGPLNRIDTGFEMSWRLRDRVVEAFGEIFYYGYGSSEGTMSFSVPATFRSEPNCVGQVFGLDEVAVMGPEGQMQPDGEVGEIVTRGPTVLSGYLSDEALTSEALRDGWFHTGDLGSMRADRTLYFAGRIKDMIKTGGVNVAAAEVEQAVAEHPSVDAVAVVGVPDERWGEAVVAAVVLLPGVEVTTEDLARHAGERLAGYKRPKHWAIVEKLPLNANGKVAKAVLAENVASLLSGSAELPVDSVPVAASVGNVTYPVRDISAAVAFYSGVLGLTLKFQDGDRYAGLSSGGVTFALAAEQEALSAQPCASFRVTDLDAAVRTIQENGGRLLRPARQGGHEVSALLTDPWGNEFVAYAPLKG